MTPARHPSPAWWARSVDRSTGEAPYRAADTSVLQVGKVVAYDEDLALATIRIADLSASELPAVPVVAGAGDLVPGDRVAVDFLAGRADQPVILGRIGPTPGLATASELAALAARVDDLFAIVTPEPWHQVGAAGEPPFENGWTNLGPVVGTPLPALSFRARAGGIDVAGYLYGGALDPTPAKPTSGIIFTLPDGAIPVGSQSNLLAASADGTFSTITPVIAQAFGTTSFAPGAFCLAVPGIATGFTGPWGLGVVFAGRFDLDPPAAV